MRLKNHTVIRVKGGQLQDAIRDGLTGAGYNVHGAPLIVNYHEVYAPIKSDDGHVYGSAWKLTLDDRKLVLAGGGEWELDDAAAKELCRADRKMLNQLTNGGDKNPLWRNACTAASIASFARGRFIEVADIPAVTMDGTKFRDLVITDGQQGVAYTMDGRRCRYPKAFKELCTVDVTSRRFLINATTVPTAEERGVAVALMCADLAARKPDLEFSAYEMLSKNQQSRFDHEMLLIKANDMAVGTISCPDAIDVAKNIMTSHNLSCGHGADVIKDPGGPEVIIDPARLAAMLKQRDALYDNSPIPL